MNKDYIAAGILLCTTRVLQIALVNEELLNTARSHTRTRLHAQRGSRWQHRNLKQENNIILQCKRVN